MNLIYPYNLQKMESELKIKIKRTRRNRMYVCVRLKKNKTYLNHTCLILHEIIYLISAGLYNWGACSVEMVVKICGSKDARLFIYSQA